jgi:GNAT superfamily N-acetyltransferase
MSTEPNTLVPRIHADRGPGHPTRIRPDHEADAIATLTLAFSADPANRWCWPASSEFLAAFPAFVRALGGRSFAVQSAFEIADVAGVALWLPPGIEPDEAEMTSVIQQTVHGSRRSAVYDVIEEMGRCHPTVPHWYLPFVGVEPMHQGRGLGAALLQRVLRLCDSERLPAYLESTNARNIPFYERLGFRSVGRIQAGTSPVIVPMVRAPRM